MNKPNQNIFLWLFALVVGVVVILGMKLTQPVIIVVFVILLALAVVALRKPLWGLYGIAFFLPFERIGSYDIAGFTVRLSQLFTFAALLSWLAIGIIRKRLDLKPNPLFFPLLFFLLINILSLLNALNFERSFVIFLVTLFTMILAVLLPNLIVSQKILEKVLKALFISTLIVTLFGFYQFAGDIVGLPPAFTGLREHYTKAILGFPRVQSTALEPLYFANFLLLPIGATYALFLSKTKAFDRRFLFVLLIFAGINLVLTVSRGGYLAAFGTLAVITLFRIKEFVNPKHIMSFFVVAAVVVFVSFQFLGMENNLEKFFTHTTGIFQGASFEERLHTFNTAFSAFMEHPFVGIGVGGFGPYASIHPYVEPEGGFYIVNNELLELFAEVGVLGLAAFLVVIAILLVRSLKAIHRSDNEFLKAVMVGALGSFIGVLIQYQTFSVLYIMQIWFLIGLMISVQNMILRNTEGVEHTLQNTQKSEPPQAARENPSRTS